MTELFWLLCLTLALLVLVVLWILGRPIPRYRGAPPGDLQQLALAARWSSLRSGVKVEQRQRDD